MQQVRLRDDGRFAPAMSGYDIAQIRMVDHGENP
jgi:hypothetical protein